MRAGEAAIRCEVYKIDGELLDNQDNQLQAVGDILRSVFPKLRNWQKKKRNITEETICKQNLQDFINHCISYKQGLKHNW